MWLETFKSLLGIFAFVAIGFLLSENRKGIVWKRVIIGVTMQIVLAFVFLKFPLLNELLLGLNHLVTAVEKATVAGASFMFGYLGGGPLPFNEKVPGASYIIAFRVLPIVLVTSALSAILFYWGIIQFFVKIFSKLLQKTLGISGPLGFGVAANVYFGVVEAPLFIRPYLAKMTRGEIFAVMSAGMATVAGTVIVLYASVLGPILPGAIGHILLASLMSAPAVVILAQMIVPEPAGVSEAVLPEVRSSAGNSLEALVTGTIDGVQMLINIIALIVVLFALVNLVNQGLAFLPNLGGEAVTVEALIGWVFRPIVWLMGLPRSEVAVAAQLMGVKVALNEFVSYTQMAGLGADALSERSRTILTYAMCGFANFAGLGLLVGGMSTMVPERRGEIVQIGVKTLICGVLATCMTGAIVGLFV